MKFAARLFRFFASLKLAIFLLLALGIVFAAGTFIESVHGAEAAKRVIYHSPWTSLLLIFLALNVAAAALDRLPWKRKHVGFVITHAGIILILAGALVTQAYGVEGQMALQEGETSGRMILGESMLQFVSEETGAVQTLGIPTKAFSWQGRERLQPSGGATYELLPRIFLRRYFPKANRVEKIEPTSNGSPALHVILESSFVKADHWLILEDPAKNRISLGPAELVFTREKIVPTSSEEGNFLEFQFPDSSIRIPAKPDAAKKISLKGTPYQVTLLSILKDAVVEGNRLVDRSKDWNNPAAELILEGEGIREKHTVFSQHPDFPTLHGMKPSQTGVQIFYHHVGGPSAKNELHFVWREGEPLLYQVRHREGVREGEVNIGEVYETGWMDFRFQVERYYPHAAVQAEFHEEPLVSQAEDHLPAVEIELARGEEKKSFWLGQGGHEIVRIGGKEFQIIFGLRTLPLGFRLALRDFRMEHYPGTQRPAGFESDVTLKNDTDGTVRDLTIRMNEPLQYKGYKVFQSGYQQPPGEPEISIFTVARDPGIPLKYFGALVLIGGTLTMFYSKKFSNHAGGQMKELMLG